MRKAGDEYVENARVKGGVLGSDVSYGNNGCFKFKREKGRLWVIISDGFDWEHVSIHFESKDGTIRTPSWDEMCWVKDVFWHDTETVIQFHPAKEDSINMHPHTLHLWKPIGVDLPKPPTILIGAKVKRK